MMNVQDVRIDWQPEMSIFASETFLREVSKEFGWLGGIDDAGRLRCILPYTVIRKPLMTMIRFRIETMPAGDGFDVGEEKDFLNGVVGYFRAKGADLILPGTTNSIFRAYPDGAVAAPYGSLVIDLEQDEESLWKNLHSKHRNVIRNAMNKGVKISYGAQYADVAHMLIQQTLQRSGMRFMTLAAFRRFVRNLGESVRIYVAEYLDQVQGCAVIPFSRHSAYYLYGGSIRNPITGALNLLQWEALLGFKKCCVTRYDFVGVRIDPEKGSKQERLMMFKERFGGRLIRGYIWKYPIHLLKFAGYSMVVRLARGGDIVDCERHKL
jgi:FemAB family